MLQWDRKTYRLLSMSFGYRNIPKHHDTCAAIVVRQAALFGGAVADA
jgi:hypothetical protein